MSHSSTQTHIPKSIFFLLECGFLSLLLVFRLHSGTVFPGYFSSMFLVSIPKEIIALAITIYHFHVYVPLFCCFLCFLFLAVSPILSFLCWFNRNFKSDCYTVCTVHNCTMYQRHSDFFFILYVNVNSIKARCVAFGVSINIVATNYWWEWKK